MSKNLALTLLGEEPLVPTEKFLLTPFLIRIRKVNEAWIGS